VNLTEAGIKFTLYGEELTKMEINFPNWRKAYQTDDHKLKIGEQLTRLEIVFPNWRISHQTDDYMFKSEKSLPYWRIPF
jgi:hypothetical protein